MHQLLRSPRVATLVVTAALFALAHTRAPAAARGAQASCTARAVTTVALVACHASEIARLDSQLAALYAVTLAALPADQRAKLEASEKRWTAFRAGDCDVFFGHATGTMAPVQAGTCEIDRTQQRIANLQGFAGK